MSLFSPVPFFWNSLAVDGNAFVSSTPFHILGYVAVVAFESTSSSSGRPHKLTMPKQFVMQHKSLIKPSCNFLLAICKVLEL